jgi:hypothetical protein
MSGRPVGWAPPREAEGLPEAPDEAALAAACVGAKGAVTGIWVGSVAAALVPDADAEPDVIGAAMAKGMVSEVKVVPLMVLVGTIEVESACGKVF